MAYNATGPRYFKPDEINFAKHWADGTEWEVAGSKNNTYTVKFTPKGLTCDCTGMTFRGKCKHVVSISNGFTQHDEDTAT